MVEAYRPETLKEALDLIKEKDIILISGGTDLMVKRKRCSGVEPLFDKAVVDRKSTRLNSSHANISYAVFCLKKKDIIHLDPLLLVTLNTHLFTVSFFAHFPFCHLHLSL